MSLQNPKFPSKLKSTEMADETELFYTPVSKVVLFATLLVSVSDLHKGLSSFVFPVKQITQNLVVATPCRFDPDYRHHLFCSEPVASGSEFLVHYLTSKQKVSVLIQVSKRTDQCHCLEMECYPISKELFANMYYISGDCPGYLLHYLEGVLYFR